MAKSIMQMDWDTCYLCGRNRIADPCVSDGTLWEVHTAL